MVKDFYQVLLYVLLPHWKVIEVQFLNKFLVKVKAQGPATLGFINLKELFIIQSDSVSDRQITLF